jgi:hypothetical protein
MEHIIDTKISGSDGNILGNLIMANSSWNRGSPDTAMKQEVYGEIYWKAIHNIERCKKCDYTWILVAILALSIIKVIC